MLVLLIIFMITTPLLSEGVNVDLPKASAKPITAEQQDPIIVSIDAQGRYYLNSKQGADKPLDAAALVAGVSSTLQAASGGAPQVLVKGDRSVDYGRVMQAMVLLQQAGVPGVGLITDPQPASS
jgi:biopolymer transport protein TolR